MFRGVELSLLYRLANSLTKMSFPRRRETSE
jgi:hypothetical protein